MARVLLIEDDDAIREGLRMGLRRLGHEVSEAATGAAGLAALREREPELVVLDLMLPDLDGFEVCGRIRAASAVPVVMLTARDGDLDIVTGLDAGADDYIVKPVHPQVLEARIRAVLRRGSASDDADGAEEAAVYGELVVDRRALTVARGGSPVALTPTELRLLLELSRTVGQVLSRQQLLEAVWGHDYLGDSRLVDACVRRLRAKLEDDPTAPRYVQTVRGFGYRFGPL
jgi:two-component system response regulator MtrA